MQYGLDVVEVTEAVFAAIVMLTSTISATQHLYDRESHSRSMAALRHGRWMARQEGQQEQETRSSEGSNTARKLQVASVLKAIM